MISVIITAVVSFISTNIDDLFILMLFYTQVNKDMKRRYIVFGQYLGIGVLIAISIIGALGLGVIPHRYLGVLGLVPIYLGLKTIDEHRKANRDNSNVERKEKEISKNHKYEENSMVIFLKRFINPSIVKIAAITVANGGDNIGIYISVFARMSVIDMLFTIIIFVLLVAVWCFASQKLSEHVFVQRYIEEYRHIFVPIVFIVLGIFILIESGTINLKII